MRGRHRWSAFPTAMSAARRAAPQQQVVFLNKSVGMKMDSRGIRLALPLVGRWRV